MARRVRLKKLLPTTWRQHHRHRTRLSRLRRLPSKEEGNSDTEVYSCPSLPWLAEDIRFFSRRSHYYSCLQTYICLVALVGIAFGSFVIIWVTGTDTVLL